MTTVKKCLFPAAGYGTRFLPATKSMPKEMLPIVTKPLIQYGVEEAMEAALLIWRSLPVAVNVHWKITLILPMSWRIRLPALTRNHVGRNKGSDEQCTFSYTRQVEMKGLGHAISVGGRLIGREPFAVILADDYCVTEGPGVLSQMVALYQRFGCSVVASRKCLGKRPIGMA